MNERRTFGIAILAFGAAAWLVGCPGEPPAAEQVHEGTGGAGGGSDGSGGSGGSGATSACGDVETNVFKASCGTCHGSVHPAKGLDLVSPDLATRVVGQPAQSSCGELLADPQHPEESLLYTKLLPSPSCGARMPINAAPLSEDAIACVKEWIAAQ